MALFDLYGGFAVVGDRQGAIRLNTMLRLGSDLGIRAAATRAAAIRMVDRGWLEVERRPRTSIYRLTGAGRQLIEEGRERILSGRTSSEWHRKWCLVTVSVPESQREVRDRLRKELSWLGFGSPSPGLYISPHDHAVSVSRLAARLGASELIQVFQAVSEVPTDPFELVKRGWSELNAVNRRYERFTAEFSERVKVLRARETVEPLQAFRLCFALLSEYRRCLYADPELPNELLPVGWHGTAARALFKEAHGELIPAALNHFDARVSMGTRSSRSTGNGRLAQKAFGPA